MITMKYKDIFINSKPSPITMYWVGFYIIITLLFFIGFLENLQIQSYGLIYILLSFISLLFITLSIATKGKSAGLVVYGKSNGKLVIRDIIIGLLVGIIFISGYLGFSIVLNIGNVANQTSPTLLGNLTILLVVGFFGVEAEEMFRASTLLPSLLKYVGDLNPIHNLFASIVIFSAFLLVFLPSFIGYTTLYVVFGLLVLALIIQLTTRDRRQSRTINVTKKNYIMEHAVSVIFVAFVFMLIHVYAYGNGSYVNNIADYISAFLFAVIVDSINWLLQSTISSRITHSVNNIVVTTTALGISLYYGILVLGIYILFISIVGAPLNKKFQKDDERTEPAIRYYALGR